MLLGKEEGDNNKSPTRNKLNLFLFVPKRTEKGRNLFLWSRSMRKRRSQEGKPHDTSDSHEILLSLFFLFVCLFVCLFVFCSCPFFLGFFPFSQELSIWICGSSKILFWGSHQNLGGKNRTRSCPPPDIFPGPFTPTHSILCLGA